MNIASRVVEMKLELSAGDDIEEVKKSAKELVKVFKYAKIYFSHNGNNFICDSEGNVAKLN